MVDPWAAAYGVGLALTAALAFAFKSPARQYGAGLLIAAWLTSFALEIASGSKAIPQAYQWLDFSLVIVFGVMGFIYVRPWAWWVSGFHLAMLFTHLAYQLELGVTTGLYLHLLAAFGYLSMACTVGTPLLRTLGGHHGVCTSYNNFMRGRSLDSSLVTTTRYAPPPAHSKDTRTPKVGG